MESQPFASAGIQESTPVEAVVEAVFGAALAGCALLLRASLDPVIGPGTPFILFFPAVTVACVVLGPLAGAFCLAVCIVGGGILFMPPLTITLHTGRLWVPFMIFLAAGSGLVWLTERKRLSVRALSVAHRQEGLLIAELQHRVKNTLAIVQSIAAQSLRSGAPPDQMEIVLTERLRALAQAHDALSETSWDSVSLRGLLTRALDPFVVDRPGRLTLRGEEVLTPADQVVGLTLCLHELATNAIKHGALSRPEGWVEIAWSACDAPGAPRLLLSWTERGGPPVKPPGRKGFGTRVLTGGLAARTRPKVTLDYPPEGLIWRAEFDLTPA
jgi:two-component sensor histidine kinase